MHKFAEMTQYVVLINSTSSQMLSKRLVLMLAMACFSSLGQTLIRLQVPQKKKKILDSLRQVRADIYFYVTNIQ